MVDDRRSICWVILKEIEPAKHMWRDWTTMAQKRVVCFERLSFYYYYYSSEMHCLFLI